MKTCYDCGYEMTKKTVYEETDENLGSIRLDNVEYYECDKCGYRTIPYVLGKLIEETKKDRIFQLLTEKMGSIKFFDNYFASNKELVRMLGKSRQAIAKDPRIRNLIYNITIKGETFYWKESVEAFLKNWDGRIRLYENLENPKFLFEFGRTDKRESVQYKENAITTVNIKDKKYYKPQLAIASYNEEKEN